MKMGYAPIANKLRSKVKRPKAKKVHYTEDEVREQLGIAKDKPLPPDLDYTTKRVDALRPYGKRKATRQLFKDASQRQYGAMDAYSEKFKKKGEEAEKDAIEGLSDSEKNKWYERERAKTLQEGIDATKRAKAVDKFKKGQK
jgi:hypothetical protein